MWTKLFVVFAHCAILLEQQEFANASPIMGQNVRAARQGQFNYVVSIMRIQENPNPLMDHQCVGSLITKRDVLTNEHCVRSEDLNEFQIIVGSVSLSRGNKYYPLWWKTYDEWCAEKDYFIEFEINDVSVIRLKRNVTEAVNPPTLSRVPIPSLYGLSVYMPGWGLSNSGGIPDVLEWVKLKVLRNSQCEKIAYKLEGVEIGLHPRILCTAAKPFALMQFGDSGGPLMNNNEIIAINAGTFPLPEQDAHPEKVNLHFSIDYYINFIVDIINNY